MIESARDIDSSRSYLEYAVVWINHNQGIISILLFLLSAIIAWITGIISAFARRSKIKIELLPGPIFCCVRALDKKFNEFGVHRVMIALYLSISNIGYTPTSIKSIHVGYHWAIGGLSWKRIRFGIGWFWLKDMTVSLSEFQVQIGDNTKVYPFLIQRNVILPAENDTYLQIGRSKNGVIYYEQGDSWGACQPVVKNESTTVNVRIIDTFGRRHKKKFTIPIVTIDAAKSYNPSIGTTLSELAVSQPAADPQSLNGNSSNTGETSE